MIDKFKIARFGAAVANHGGRTYIVGGIIKNEILKSSEEIYSFTADDPKAGILNATPVVPLTPRPLLIGISVVSRGNSLISLSFFHTEYTILREAEKFFGSVRLLRYFLDISPAPHSYLNHEIFTNLTTL